MDHKTIIGWREYVSLPDWHVRQIKAKSDTGARTSALDVANIVELSDNRVRFDIVASRQPNAKRIPCEADIVRRTHVKSSTGKGQERIFVSTRLKIGKIEKDIEISLVSRPTMLCRMLLGRKALEPDLVVDSSARYLVSRRIKPKKSTQAKASQQSG